MIASHALKIVCAAVLAAIAPALVVAAAPAPSPQAAIATRQAGYKKMGAATKALKEQLAGDAPSKDVMLGAARTIAATAREQGRLFPAGSGPSAGTHTDALANIWTDRANFDAKMAAVVAESGKLLTVVNGGNVAAIRAQYKITGATCAACHRQFRADT